MDSSLSIRMVRENLALAIALWTSAKRGVINATYVPASAQVVSDTGETVAVSAPLEVRSDQDLVRCVANQVRGAFAFSVMQTHRILESFYGTCPLEETDPDLRGARCVFYLLNNTLARDMLSPAWICPPDYQREFKVKSIEFSLDAAELNGKKVCWDDFGGLNKYLALLEYCGAMLAGASPRKAPSRPRREGSDTQKGEALAPAEERAGAAASEAAQKVKGVKNGALDQSSVGLASGAAIIDEADEDLEDLEAIGDALEEGLDAPDEDSANPVGEFVRERCVLSSSTNTIAGSLYSAYLFWCEGQGREPLTQRSFGMRLTTLGLERRRRGRGRHWWMGIGLKG